MDPSTATVAAAPSTSDSPADTRRARILLLVAAVTYLVWWGFVELLLAGSFNPLWSRLIVVSSLLALLGLSFVSSPAASHLGTLLAGGLYVLTAHYFHLAWRNGVTGDWVVGAFITVLAVAALLRTRRGLLGYSVFVLALAAAITLGGETTRGSLLLPGLGTLLMLSNLLLRSQLTLEHERAERVRVEAERAAATAAVALREEFIAIAAHELRTPLAGLRLLADVTTRELQRNATLSPERVGRLLEGLHRQVTRLSRTVDEQLDNAQLTSGSVRLKRERVDLRALLGELVDVLATEINASGCVVEVQAQGDLLGQWDRFRLEQVFGNLLRNALVYGGGRPVQVSAQDLGERVSVTVTDEGIGIALADQARIFERFERAVSSRHYGGLGIGLYVVRQLVIAHGGSVVVESEPDRGSRFTVELSRVP